MIGIILCVIIFGAFLGIGFYIKGDTLGGCAGTLLGCLCGIIIGGIITICMLENADSQLIKSAEYKIQAIGGQYWETNENNRKVVHYFDEGNELQSYAAPKNEIEYSNNVSEPTLIIEEREAVGGFINFWCFGDTDFTRYRVVMPQIVK